MATTRNRTYRILAWALAIALTVLSLPIVPFSTWSSNLTETIGDSVGINAHAYSFDNRPRVGAWWWHKEDADDTTAYLTLLEQAGVTEVYYYAGWDFADSAKNFNNKMGAIHTFVSEAMKHGIATSFLMDDLGYMSTMATNFITYRNTYPDDWAYGFHFDCEVPADMKASFDNAVTYFVNNGIYVEYDFNPAWSDGSVYTAFVDRFKGGKGCMHLMAYRTASAQAIFDRAQDRNNAVTLCKNNNCDVVVGMECTLHESDGSVLGTNVSLAAAGKNKDTVVDYIRGLYTIMENTGLNSDFGVAIHHARSFANDISGEKISDNKTTSYKGGGVTESRTTGSHVQTTTTTKNTSGMTLTKQALYYKSGLNVSLADYGRYTDTAMTNAILNDYNTNGMISTSAGEYYEVKVTGKGNASGDVYPILFSGDMEYWACSYPNGSSISTSQNTVTAVYRVNGKTGDPLDIDFGIGAGFGVSLESASSYTLNTIEINVYRYTSGGGDTPTSPTQQSTSTTKTTTTQGVTTTTQAVTPTGGTVSGNLIINGDFSNGLTDWSVTPSDIASVSNGQLVISGNPSKDLEVKASFTATVGGGKTYTLRFDMENSNGVKVKVHNNEGDGGYTSYTAPGTYTFTTASSVLSTNSNYKTRFDVIVNAPKYTDISAVLDNFILVEGTSIPSGEEESSAAPTTYSVTVNGGTADKTTAAAGDTVTVTAGSPATGKQFSGWTGSGVTFANASNVVTTFTMPASNVTVSANYTDINYTVSVTLGTANKNTATYGQTVTLTANTPATGMEFDKWVTKSGSAAVTFANATSTSTSFTMPAGNVAVEATYKAKTYTVSVTNGSASPSSQMYNNTVTITANAPQTGYQFDKWTTSDGVTFANASNSTTTFTMPAKNVSVTATYKKINYTVSVTGGTASKTSANYGDTITLTPTVPSGKVFDKWTISPNTVTISGNTFTMPASNVTVTASFKDAAYTVTVNSGSASPAGGIAGDTINISANTPETGYQFDKWTTSDGVSFKNANSANTSFTMPAKNVTVTATYKKVNYTVSVTGGTASKTSANYGDTITLTPTVPSGYAFSGWSSSDVTITNNAFTMPAKNVSITANFTEVIVEPDPPATPTLVSATADGYNVIFKWNAVTGADGYQILRKTSGGSFTALETVAGGSVTSYTDVALEKGTYTYTVKAYATGSSGPIWGGNNTTGKSATVTFGAPTLTSAVASAAGITVSWQKVTGATGYRLYRKDGANWVTVKTLADVNTTSYLAKGLVSGETYTYTVQAYYDSPVTGATQWSAYNATGVSATAQFGSPETEGQANGMKITINWATVSGADGYRIYRKTADSSWHTLATVDAPTTTYTDETPIPGIYYTYTVQAYTTENGVKIYSSYDVTGTTKRVMLETPELSEAEVTGEGVVVSWEAVDGATGYRLYRWNGTAWKTVKTVIGINTVSYTDKNSKAVAGAKYTVQAFRNANGANVWSDHNEAGVTAS